MNKHEKEVVKAQLMSEKQTLKTIQAVYKKALQDIENKLIISNGKINTLLEDVDTLSDEEKSILQSQIYQRKMQRSLKSQLEIMLKDLAVNQYGTINEYLRNSYQNGYIGALYNINVQGMPLILPVDPYLVHRAIEIDSKIKHGLYQNLVDKVDVFKRRIANDISRGIASSASYHDMAAWIRHDTKVSVGKSMRIVRTEGNRVYNAAALDCGKGAKERGCDLVKVWDSTLDMKTRPTHRECDGQIRELEESFKNANGEAKAPGQFGIASEDINCRCAVLIKPRWDVDSRFTKRDNQTGELKEFEGCKEYEEFKEKYWKNIGKTEEKTTPVPQLKQTPKAPEIKFVKANSIEEAEQYALNNKIRHVDYSDIPLETANLLNEAAMTLPEDIRPAYIASSKNIEKAIGKKLGRTSNHFYGVHVEAMDLRFGEYPNIEYDFEGGQVVGISSSFKNLSKIQKSKLEGNKIYSEKHDGHTQFFNTDGKSTAFHEMGHVYADKKGIPKGFAEDAEKWFKESNVDMLKDVDEAWAEAWGGYHTQNPDLPDYIAKYIHNATNMPIDKSVNSDIIKAEVEKGTIKLELNHEKQARHIKGKPEYKEGKSYVTISEDEIQEVIYQRNGTGKLYTDKNGKPVKEKVDCLKTIGVDIDEETKSETVTDKGTIHYSKTGTHLVPRKES